MELFEKFEKEKIKNWNVEKYEFTGETSYNFNNVNFYRIIGRDNLTFPEFKLEPIKEKEIICDDYIANKPLNRSDANCILIIKILANIASHKRNRCNAA